MPRTHPFNPGPGACGIPALLAATALACLLPGTARAAMSPLDAVRAAVDFSNRRAAADTAPNGATTAKPGTYLVDAVVNDTPLTDVVEVEVRDDGSVIVPRAAWQAAGLKPLAQSIAMSGGDSGFVLDSVPGLTYGLDVGRLQLAVTAPPSAFVGTRTALGRNGRPALTTPALGAHLDYDLTVTAIDDGTVTYGGLAQAVVSTPQGALVSGAVFAGASRGSRFHAIRTETFWQLDLPDRRETLIMGDTITSSGTWSRPVRFGGLRFGRNFALEPDFVTFPMPALAGSAALPSTADLLVNGNLQRRGIAIAPGPFAITNLPTITGEGRVNLVVRDARGIETVISRDYYLAPSLLAPGLSDYSLEIGALRRNYAIRDADYGPLLAAASWRQGLTETLTAGARIELQEKRQAFGGEVNATLGGLVAVRIAAGYSFSAVDGPLPARSGGHYLVTAEHSRRGFGVFAQVERSDRGYLALGGIFSETQLRDRFQFGTNLNVGGRVNLGLRYIEQHAWNGDGNQIIAGNASTDLPGRFRLGAYFSDQLGPARGWTVGLTLGRSFGGLRSATANVARDEQGDWSSRVSIAQSPPQGPGLGWHLDAFAERSSSVRGGVIANAAFGQFAADADIGERASAVRLGARGSLGWLGGMAFAARTIGERAFAVVRVPDLPGITIERSNQAIARTDRHGRALVMGLQPFRATALRLRAEDLPFDVEIGGIERTAVPFARAGVVLDFPVRRSRNALVALRLADGTPVPVGAIAALEGGRTFPVGRGGEVYLGDLADRNVLVVQWATGRCTARFDAPTEVEARIGPLACENAP